MEDASTHGDPWDGSRGVMEQRNRGHGNHVFGNPVIPRNPDAVQEHRKAPGGRPEVESEAGEGDRGGEASRRRCRRGQPIPLAPWRSWSRKVLRVPPGHPLAGKPMELPSYCVEFIRDALTHRESLLCLGRKNSKSAAAIAVYLSGEAGRVRLRTSGYRAGVCSVNKDKANELKMQMEAIAEASRSRRG